MPVATSWSGSIRSRVPKSAASLEDDCSSIMSKQLFDDLKSVRLCDDISEAGSDEDEVIPLDDLHPMQADETTDDDAASSVAAASVAASLAASYSAASSAAASSLAAASYAAPPAAASSLAASSVAAPSVVPSIAASSVAALSVVPSIAASSVAAPSVVPSIAASSVAVSPLAASYIAASKPPTPATAASDHAPHADEPMEDDAASSLSASSLVTSSLATSRATTAAGRGTPPRASKGGQSRGGASNTDEWYEVDELQLLLADTPLRRLKKKTEGAESMTRTGDHWGCVRMRQECLALCRIYFGVYRGAERGRHPLLLATSHFRLAQAYAALKCFPQVGEHSNFAMQALPQHGHTNKKVAAFRMEVNLLLGESLLLCAPPKPLTALQHFAVAGDVAKPDEVTDSSIKFLVSQSYDLIGSTKLEEAKAAKEAFFVIEARFDKLKARLVNMERKDPDRKGVLQKLDGLAAEMAEEVRFEQKLLEEASVNLNKAVDQMTDVVVEESEQLKEKLPDGMHKKHPLFISLVRRNAELMLKLATVEGLRGNTKKELSHLKEIMSNQADCGFLPPGLISTVLKEQGAVYVVGRKYDEAIDTYKALMDLQSERYPDDVAKLAVAQAEAFKLIGNVYVAKKFYGRALEHYSQALKLFSKYLGPQNGLVVDLEHRVNEIRASYMDS